VRERKREKVAMGYHEGMAIMADLME